MRFLKRRRASIDYPADAVAAVARDRAGPTDPASTFSNRANDRRPSFYPGSLKCYGTAGAPGNSVKGGSPPPPSCWLALRPLANAAKALRTKQKQCFMPAMNIAAHDSTSAPAYLARLNAEQRRAVEHGDGGVAGPLLVIAGAGSGKTNTLAHRVAHLIVNGADPRRILLMTFSRRAAAEMARRVERIAGAGAGPRRRGHRRRARPGPAPSTASARGCCANTRWQIGLDPAFTIHDREDSADLMNLVRHELGFSKTESRFPTKGTCLAIYSRAVNAEAPLDEVLGDGLSLVRRLGGRAASSCSPPMSRPSRRRTCSITTTCCSTGRRWPPSRRSPSILAQRFDHMLVDEYQDTNRLQASILLALKPDGRGLTVVGDDAQSIYSFRAADGAQHPRFPDAVRARRRGRHARAQLPLDPADPRRRQRRDRRGRASASPRTSGPSASHRRTAAAGHRARRGRAGALRRRAGAGGPRGRHSR